MYRPSSPPVSFSAADVPTEAVAGCREPAARHVHIDFSVPKLIGSGTFGSVYAARMGLSGEPVAIKRVKHDHAYRSRELEILRTIDHQNIVYMKYYFKTANDQGEEYIHFVMEYMPKSLYNLINGCRRTFQNIPKFHCKIFIFQLARALHYLHQQNICHRDVKTQNILVDPKTLHVKLCDFGSAKQLHHNEPSVSYICSRYYRAPELLLEVTNYTTAIDIWSLAICFIELLSGNTPFNGTCEATQLTAITQFLPSHVPSSCVKLLKAILVYDWEQRPSAIEICAHEAFDDLRSTKADLPSAPLFNWSVAEFDGRPEMRSKVLPRYVL